MDVFREESKSVLQRTAPDIIFNVLEQSATSLLPQIHQHYQEHGFVVLRALTPAFCKKAIGEQVEKILLQQPWKPEYKLKVYKDNDETRKEELDFQTQRDEYIDTLLKAPLPSKTLQRLNDAWPLHKTFGACCDDAVFHLPTVWEVRQNEALFIVAKELMGGRDDLWVDINRCIQKMPTKGEKEFLHWDLDKFSDYAHDSGIQGKVAFSDGQFVCVPGTHTRKFHEEFNAKYKEHYLLQQTALEAEGETKVRRKVSKVGLKSDKPDPLDLIQQKRVFLLPAGCVLFWSSNLLHGQEPTPRWAPIEFGMYLGYMVAHSREDYTKKAIQRQKHVNERLNKCGYLNLRPPQELADRIYSYEHGVAPMLWPSLDTVWFYPQKYENFPHLMASVIQKMTPDAVQKYKVAGITKDWNPCDVLLPWENEGYIPPPLTDLGRKLLVGLPIPSPSSAASRLRHVPASAGGEGAAGPALVAKKTPAIIISRGGSVSSSSAVVAPIPPHAKVNSLALTTTTGSNSSSRIASGPSPSSSSLSTQSTSSPQKTGASMMSINARGR